MSTNSLKKVPLAAGAAGVIAQMADTALGQEVDELIAGIKSGNDKVRTEAWLNAGEAGAPAVKPLAKVMTHNDLEVARAAKRALWKIVRHTGRPRANKERRAVETELTGLLGKGQPISVRREVLWMLSEIGARNSIKRLRRLFRFITRRYRSFKSEVANRPPSNCTIGRKSGGITGKTVMIIQAG